MTVHTFTAIGDNFIHVLDTDTGMIAVDPGSARPVLHCIETTGRPLTHILVTHGHMDHTMGCADLKQATGCRLVGPPGSCPDLDREVADGDTVQAGGVEFTVLSVPGHTRDSVAYCARAEDTAFTGDTLFTCGCGRLIGGSAEQMWNSLCRLRDLPASTTVYPGHDYTIENLEFAAHLEPGNRDVAEALAAARECRPPFLLTIAQEKRCNPFLRCDTPALQDAAGLPGAPPAQVFAEIRRRKDRW